MRERGERGRRKHSLVCRNLQEVNVYSKNINGSTSPSVSQFSSPFFPQIIIYFHFLSRNKKANSYSISSPSSVTTLPQLALFPFQFSSFLPFPRIQQQKNQPTNQTKPNMQLFTLLVTITAAIFSITITSAAPVMESKFSIFSFFIFSFSTFPFHHACIHI